VHGLPVAVAWHTVTVAPAIGCPVGPNTMSSFLDPCALVGTVQQANAATESTRANIALFIMFIAPYSFSRPSVVFIPSTASRIYLQLAASILSLLPAHGERKA
jgi:hypothetical protein